MTEGERVRGVGVDIIKMKWWMVHVFGDVFLFVTQRFVERFLNADEQ